MATIEILRFNQINVMSYKYLTIIPRVRVRYEMVDSQQGV